nr:type II toxin-antitoxin system HicA family toxin [Phormidium sp. FACHB-1136]
MPKLPRISSKEAIRPLERLGFEQVRQTGSHVVMKKVTEDWFSGLRDPNASRIKSGYADWNS